jgi:hypothetical protein
MTVGRPRAFETPDDLRRACVEYFEWAEQNPLKEERLFCQQGVVIRDAVYKMRAMTLTGLCLHAGISRDAWNEYKARPDFTGVTKEAEEVIYEQKFSGAAADLFNANIIARDLGLKDETKTEVTGGVKIETIKRIIVDPK